MSRSYREPFSGICGSKHNVDGEDRKLARRAVRRAENQAIKMARGGDVVLPHKFECAGNDSWGWPSDGGVRWMPPDHRWPGICRK